MHGPSSLLPHGSTIRSSTKIATLWAGYGTISRIHVNGNSQTLIHKEINLRDRQNTDASHVRKLLSYHVEAEFYKLGGLASSLLLLAPWVQVPKPLGVKAEADKISILLSDLGQAFPNEHDELDLAHAKSALRWLAGWHAHFWGSETPEDRSGTGPISASGIWMEGGYWHLSTRMDEWENIGSSKRWKQIKDAAPSVAQRLRGPIDEQDPNPSRFRTILHGDPKGANILFENVRDNSLPACAFCDMQYVGFGYGAVDMAYLLATSVEAKVLERNEAALVETYLSELKLRLTQRGLTDDARDYTPDVFQTHLDLALIDWVRFMAGWGMWDHITLLPHSVGEGMSNPEDQVTAPTAVVKKALVDAPVRDTPATPTDDRQRQQMVDSARKQMSVDVVICKDSAAGTAKPSKPKVQDADTSSDEEWFAAQAQPSESADSEEEEEEEKRIASRSGRQARGKKVPADITDSDSEEEAHSHHTMLCTKCDRGAQNKRIVHEDDDLEEPLGPLILCSTCSVTWHEPWLEYKEEILFRCFRCKFSAHMDCILQQYIEDVDDSGRDHIPKGVGSQQYFQTEWKCVDCIMWDDHVESIITYRPAADSDPANQGMREFYVKFSSWSYRHCSWVTERWLSNLKTENSKYRSFLRKIAKENEEAIAAGTAPPWPKSVEDALPPGVLEIERVLDAQYYDGFGEQTLENVKKVLIKWRGLPHSKLSWESVYDSDDPDFPELAQQYAIFIKRDEISEAADASATKRLFAEYKSQPTHVVGGELKNYQLDGLNWLMYKWSKRMPSILADDMGLGKTVQIVALLACLHYDKSLGPFLIAAPSSTLGHWAAEFAKWAPNLVVVRYRGDAESRKAIRKYEIFGPKDSDRDKSKNVRMHILLANYETLTPDSKFFKSIKFDVLICDEGHRLKNDAAKVFNAFRDHLTLGHKIILTGTPLQNNIRELFNLLCFLDPSKFGNPAEWEAKYGEDSLTDAMVKEIHEVEIVVPLSLSPLQTQLYKGVLAKNAKLLKSIGVSASGKSDVRVSSLKNILMDLRSICNHPYILPGVEPLNASPEESHRNLIDAGAKISLLHKMLPKLKASGHRVLIFSQFKRSLDIIQDFLTMEQYGWCRMDGGTAIHLRQQMIDDFNSPNSNAFVFLLTTRTGAEGINLTAADTIILYDADWNPQRDIQAMARAHRIGQKNPVVVYRFFHRRCVEEKILEVGKKKLVLNHLLIAPMAGEEEVPEDISSIIRYGAKALFEETEATASESQIKYDDAEVDKLLDRSAIFAEPSAKTDSSEPEGFKLGAFAKLWQSEKPDFDESTALVDLGADSTAADAEAQASFWDNVLKETAAQQAAREAVEYDEWGRARRKRKSVNYSEASAKRQRTAERELDEDDDQDIDMPAVAEIEDAEFQPEDSPRDQDDEDDIEDVVTEEVLTSAIIKPRAALSSLPTTSASVTNAGLPVYSTAGAERLNTRPPTLALQPALYSQPYPQVGNASPGFVPHQQPAAAPLTATLIKAAKTLVKSYTSPKRPPACWLCFRTELHPIDECEMRRKEAYLLDAFIQMECAVRALRLPPDIRSELIFKMRILEWFLRGLNVDPPIRVPEHHVPNPLYASVPAGARPVMSRGSLLPMAAAPTLRERLMTRQRPKKTATAAPALAPVMTAATTPVSISPASQQMKPAFYSDASASASATTISHTPDTNRLASVPVSSSITTLVPHVAVDGSSSLAQASTLPGQVPASSNLSSAPLLSAQNAPSAGLSVTTSASAPPLAVGTPSLSPAAGATHILSPVPRSGGPNPPVVSSYTPQSTGAPSATQATGAMHILSPVPRSGGPNPPVVSPYTPQSTGAPSATHAAGAIHILSPVPHGGAANPPVVSPYTPQSTGAPSATQAAGAMHILSPVPRSGALNPPVVSPYTPQSTGAPSATQVAEAMHIFSPVPRSGGPNPPVVSPYIPQSTGAPSATLASPSSNLSSTASIANGTTCPSPHVVSDCPRPSMGEATAASGAVSQPPLMLRSHAVPTRYPASAGGLGSSTSLVSGQPPPVSTYAPGHLPSTVLLTTVTQSHSTSDAHRTNNQQSSVPQFAYRPKCLICLGSNHFTESPACPMIGRDPVQYRKRLLSLISSGEISHLTLNQMQHMQMWAITAQSRLKNRTTAGLSLAAPQTMAAAVAHPSGYISAPAHSQVQRPPHQQLQPWNEQQHQQRYQLRQQQQLYPQQLQQLQQQRQQQQGQRQQRQSHLSQHQHQQPLLQPSPQPKPAHHQQGTWQQPHQNAFSSHEERQAAIATYHNYVARGGGSSASTSMPAQQAWSTHPTSMGGASSAVLMYPTPMPHTRPINAFSPPIPAARITEIAEGDQIPEKTQNSTHTRNAEKL
ncbi:hypothetical protein HDU86_006092 [Geranomyces michiganensis]|nr:hypothetical protein HDU86_006092 [Geranomyces michiganensis]